MYKISETFQPRLIVHLAAQAGVRYSLDNPRAYIDTNIVGTFNVLELAKDLGIEHLLMASTSSVYGANTSMPFHEGQLINTPLTVYAATKASTEALAHSYAHIHKLPVTMFRFFTVYGPWGRPDMALFKFTRGIINEEPIDIYNHGQMKRDFTYVDDLVFAIMQLLRQVPIINKPVSNKDSLSRAAPFRIVNIGNSTSVNLMDFVYALEEKLGKAAIKNMMEMQTGDVPATWADASLLEELISFRPNTGIKHGISQFVDWYLDYYTNDV